MTARKVKNMIAAGTATTLMSVAGMAAAADFPVDARAELMSPDGQALGEVSFSEGPNGMLVSTTLENMPEGTHAFHIHTAGTCSPDFGAAGGHFNPTDAHHGFMAEGGPHLGDLPNIMVPGSGALEFDAFLYHVTLDGENALMDDDGAAVMIHEGADDYKSDPAGDAGSRIACGVISAN